MVQWNIRGYYHKVGPLSLSYPSREQKYGGQNVKHCKDCQNDSQLSISKLFQNEYRKCQQLIQFTYYVMLRANKTCVQQCQAYYWYIVFD